MRVKDIKDSSLQRRIRRMVELGRVKSWTDEVGYICYDEKQVIKPVKFGRPRKVKRGK